METQARRPQTPVKEFRAIEPVDKQQRIVEVEFTEEEEEDKEEEVVMEKMEQGAVSSSSRASFSALESMLVAVALFEEKAQECGFVYPCFVPSAQWDGAAVE